MLLTPQRSPLRILLVEDSPSYSRLLLALLQSVEEPPEVTQAETLIDAISEVEQTSFSAILLDLGLPDCFGLDTLRRLVPHANGAPIVVLTGISDQSLAIDAMANGAQDFLTKSEIDFDRVWRAVGYAIERSRLQQEQARLQRELIDAACREQARIGRDLHDGLGQELGGLAMLCAGIARRLEKSESAEAEAAGFVSGRIRKALRDLRVVIRGMTPVELDAHGLPAALANLCALATSDSSVPCQFRSNLETLELDAETGSHLFRITQESVNNALKHGSPTEVRVTLARNKGRLVLHVEDDGVGYDMKEVQDGMGLKTMTYRAKLIGASFEVKSARDIGTITCCSLPAPE